MPLPFQHFSRKFLITLAGILLFAFGLYWYWNQQLKYTLALKNDPETAILLSDSITTNQQLTLVNQVRGILAHNCYTCHGDTKQKGLLRLDEKEHVFAGGENGPVIVPGNSEQSELIRRVKLSESHKEVMPSKGDLLSDREIGLLSLWIEKGAPWPEGVDEPSAFPMAKLEPYKPPLPAGKGNPIDRWINFYFDEKNIQWPETVDDRTYLRRIFMDIIGLQPSPDELKNFKQDPRADKRERWVEQLLARNDDYAQHWLTFWNDALRNDYTGTGYITGGRFNINSWLYNSLRNNKPYDVFAKELLYPSDSSRGFIAGIQWRGTVNASQRVEMQAAQNVGQVLLGLNLKCASCHDSFVSDWKLEDAYAFASIFAEETLEISRCEKPLGKFAATRLLWPALGVIDSSATRDQKLKQLAESLVQPADGRLYRTLVNRIWRQMMGRGIIEPVDEMDNTPWSSDLLDWLAVNFTENNNDVKKLIYLIATSKTYQLPAVRFDSPADLLAEDYQFRGMVSRRLTAEQFSDAVSQLINPVFETNDLKFDPFVFAGYEPTGQRLTRASLVANNAFLTALGRPNREVVSTSRESQASLLQALELTNGETLNRALNEGARNWKNQFDNPEELINELYSRTLLRKPSPTEMQIARQALETKPNEEQIADLFWALLLHPEFQLIK